MLYWLANINYVAIKKIDPIRNTVYFNAHCSVNLAHSLFAQ